MTNDECPDKFPDVYDQKYSRDMRFRVGYLRKPTSNDCNAPYDDTMPCTLACKQSRRTSDD